MPDRLVITSPTEVACSTQCIISVQYMYSIVYSSSRVRPSEPWHHSHVQVLTQLSSIHSSWAIMSIAYLGTIIYTL